jgi:hypothetical protein
MLKRHDHVAIVVGRRQPGDEFIGLRRLPGALKDVCRGGTPPRPLGHVVYGHSVTCRCKAARGVLGPRNR